MPALSDSTLMGFLTHPNYAISKLVVIEEAQFFPDLVDFVKQVVDTDKKHCIVVGLDGDSERKPFGQVLEVCAMAEEVVKFNALCKRCGNGTEAPFTYAHNVVTNSVSNVCVGADDRYIPLCREHYLLAKYPERSRSVSITRQGC
jgi:thymidine kinase